MLRFCSGEVKKRYLRLINGSLIHYLHLEETRTLYQGERSTKRVTRIRYICRLSFPNSVVVFTREVSKFWIPILWKRHHKKIMPRYTQCRESQEFPQGHPNFRQAMISEQQQQQPPQHHQQLEQEEQEQQPQQNLHQNETTQFCQHKQEQEQQQQQELKYSNNDCNLNSNEIIAKDAEEKEKNDDVDVTDASPRHEFPFQHKKQHSKQQQQQQNNDISSSNDCIEVEISTIEFKYTNENQTTLSSASSSLSLTPSLSLSSPQQSLSPPPPPPLSVILLSDAQHQQQNEFSSLETQHQHEKMKETSLLVKNFDDEERSNGNYIEKMTLLHDLKHLENRSLSIINVNPSDILKTPGDGDGVHIPPYSVLENNIAIERSSRHTEELNLNVTETTSTTTTNTTTTTTNININITTTTTTDNIQRRNNASAFGGHTPEFVYQNNNEICDFNNNQETFFLTQLRSGNDGSGDAGSDAHHNQNVLNDSENFKTHTIAAAEHSKDKQLVAIKNRKSKLLLTETQQQQQQQQQSHQLLQKQQKDQLLLQQDSQNDIQIDHENFDQSQQQQQDEQGLEQQQQPQQEHQQQIQVQEETHFGNFSDCNKQPQQQQPPVEKMEVDGEEEEEEEHEQQQKPHLFNNYNFENTDLGKQPQQQQEEEIQQQQQQPKQETQTQSDTQELLTDQQNISPMPQQYNVAAGTQRNNYYHRDQQLLRDEHQQQHPYYQQQNLNFYIEQSQQYQQQQLLQQQQLYYNREFQLQCQRNYFLSLQQQLQQPFQCQYEQLLSPYQQVQQLQLQQQLLLQQLQQQPYVQRSLPYCPQPIPYSQWQQLQSEWQLQQSLALLQQQSQQPELQQPQPFAYFQQDQMQKQLQQLQQQQQQQQARLLNDEKRENQNPSLPLKSKPIGLNKSSHGQKVAELDSQQFSNEKSKRQQKRKKQHQQQHQHQHQQQNHSKNKGIEKTEQNFPSLPTKEEKKRNQKTSQNKSMQQSTNVQKSQRNKDLRKKLKLNQTPTTLSKKNTHDHVANIEVKPLNQQQSKLIDLNENKNVALIKSPKAWQGQDAKKLFPQQYRKKSRLLVTPLDTGGIGGIEKFNLPKLTAKSIKSPRQEKYEDEEKRRREEEREMAFRREILSCYCEKNSPDKFDFTLLSTFNDDESKIRMTNEFATGQPKIETPKTETYFAFDFNDDGGATAAAAAAAAATTTITTSSHDKESFYMQEQPSVAVTTATTAPTTSKTMQTTTIDKIENQEMPNTFVPIVRFPRTQPSHPIQLVQPKTPAKATIDITAAANNATNVGTAIENMTQVQRPQLQQQQNPQLPIIDEDDVSTFLADYRKRREKDREERLKIAKQQQQQQKQHAQTVTTTTAAAKLVVSGASSSSTSSLLPPLTMQVPVSVSLPVTVTAAPTRPTPTTTTTTTTTSMPKTQFQSWPQIKLNTNDNIAHIPKSMLSDQYGICGLLSAIKSAETKPNIANILYGVDLNALGLDLRSNEMILPTFDGPFAFDDLPNRNRYERFPSPTPPKVDKFLNDNSNGHGNGHGNNDIDNICQRFGYPLTENVRSSLTSPAMKILSDEQLFYVFYSQVQDLKQLLAADELYSRDWAFYMKDKAWISHDTNFTYMLFNKHYERGNYIYFDPNEWSIFSKYMEIDLKQIDDRPKIPKFTSDNEAASSSHSDDLNTTSSS